MPTITVNNVSKYYHAEKRWLRRKSISQEIGVENVSFTVKQGEFLFLIGSSGAGKSTLLNLITGQLKPDSGTIQIDDTDLSKILRWKEKKLPLLMGYVAQYHTIDHRVTVQKYLEDAAEIGARKFRDKDHYEERIKKVLGLTGLAGAEKRYPVELTAGERRRVELARALINSPPILVLDEVIANLDADSMWDVFLLLNELNARGTTVIMVTHSSTYVNMLRRRVITLVHGRIYNDENKGRYGEAAKNKW